MGLAGGQQGGLDLLWIGVVGHPHRQANAGDRVTMAPVDDFILEEAGVGHNNRHLIQGTNFRTAGPNAGYRALDRAKVDKIPHLHGPFKHHHQAADHVLNQGLQTKANTNAQATGNQGNGTEVNAPQLQNHHPPQQDQGVFGQDGDRLLGRLVNAGNVQKPRPQPIGGGIG